MDDQQPDSQHQPESRWRRRAQAALVRLGLAVVTALFCMLLVFGVGWTAATLW